MFVPDGLTEAKVVAAIEHVARVLAHNYVFGYFDLDDVRQEAARFAVEALPRYDPGGFDDGGEPRRRLENFLFSHVKNRLINLVRDKYHRNDPPCGLCHTGRQAEHPDGRVCDRYRAWKARQGAKANLARPLDIGGVADECEPALREESAVEAEAHLDEAVARIDAALPPELRADYLRMRAGERLPRGRRAKVVEAVRGILGHGDAG